MKINILMSTYNGEQFLAEQIESIQKQTVKDWTLYIRDDGSSDTTPEIIKQYTQLDSRIVFINADNRENFGVIKNFYTLLKHSNLNVLHESMIKTQSDHANTELVQELTENTVTGGTAMINHVLAELWTSTDDLLMHDWYLALLASALGNLAYVDYPTELYRQHDANVLGARTWTKRMKNWFKPHKLVEKYWWLINASQTQARFLLYLALTPEKRDLVENFTTIMDKPLIQRIKTLNQYGLRKNRTFHTLVFRTLIITKFGYRRNK